MIVNVDQFVTPLVIYCDENGLSLRQGRDLAEWVADELLGAAEERRGYLPPELIDDEGEEGA